jgi:2-polyprenyl-3-methyl-5-hydroxy-6-metoxy-1,4-benzoquinol methylase
MDQTYAQKIESIARTFHADAAYPDKFIEHLFQQYFCDGWLRSLLRPTDHLLELGVGDGLTLERLSKVPLSYTVVEGAPSLVAAVNDRYPDIEVVESMFEDYHPRKAFDKVFALHVMEHVNDPVALMKHMRPWLATAGELVIIVPNSESIHRQLAVLMNLQPQLDTLSARDHVVGHQRVYSLAGLRADLVTAGFEVIEEKGFFFKPLPNSMMLEFSHDLLLAMNVIAETLPANLMGNIAVRARLTSR